MCEFDVLFQGKTVFKDAVYAKAEANEVTVRNILGVSRTFANCTIEEVDVASECLVLQTAKK